LAASCSRRCFSLVEILWLTCCCTGPIRGFVRSESRDGKPAKTRLLDRPAGRLAWCHSLRRFFCALRSGGAGSYAAVCPAHENPLCGCARLDSSAPIRLRYPPARRRFRRIRRRHRTSAPFAIFRARISVSLARHSARAAPLLLSWGCARVSLRRRWLRPGSALANPRGRTDLSACGTLGGWARAVFRVEYRRNGGLFRRFDG